MLGWLWWAELLLLLGLTLWVCLLLLGTGAELGVFILLRRPGLGDV